MKYIKQIIYVGMVLVFVLMCWMSFTIHTSVMSEKLPWYDEAGRKSFIVIPLLLSPAMILIGGIFHVILGRFIKLSIMTRLLPFLSAVALSIPVLHNSMRREMQITGAAVSIASGFLAIVFCVFDLLRIRICWSSTKNRAVEQVKKS